MAQEVRGRVLLGEGAAVGECTMIGGYACPHTPLPLEPSVFWVSGLACCGVGHVLHNLRGLFG